MISSYTYTKDASCCPGEDVTISIKRVIVADMSQSRPSGFICGHRANNESIINYKALSKRNGNTRQYNVKRVGMIGSRGRFGQTVQAIGSTLTPGNISRVRSPVRSRLYSAITPGIGLPGVRGIRGRERSYRCTEGYQFGGRFTDSSYSTCGQQLFDLPSILGATIAAIRRAARGEVGQRGPTPTPVTAGRTGASMVQERDPNIRAASIPKVGPANRNLQQQTVEKLIPQMGKPNIAAHRMIRRDGFDLEPVVQPSVLRTIPDNRDMEGATYLLTIPDGGMGGEELGLLSNTGVTNLTYVREDGTSVSLAKVRELTVGERRKLGRTVNAAMKKDDSDDPLARLNFVSEETGDGIQVAERAASTSTRKPPAPAKKAPEGPETSKITSVDAALAHLSEGGNLSDIAPSTLQKAIQERNALEATNRLVTTPQKQQYLVRDAKYNNEHLHATFAADIQRHLGLTAPDVAFVGEGDRRRYLVQDAASTVQGGSIDRKKSIAQASPREMTAMLIADVLTGIDNRLPTSVATVTANDKSRLMAIDNPSALIPLDEREIAEATKRRIAEMRSIQKQGIYGKYFATLQQEQRQIVQQQFTKLIERAEAFKINQFRESLMRNGELSDAEIAHLDIIESIYETRIRLLRGSLENILDLVGAEEQ